MEKDLINLRDDKGSGVDFYSKGPSTEKERSKKVCLGY